MRLFFVLYHYEGVQVGSSDAFFDYQFTVATSSYYFFLHFNISGKGRKPLICRYNQVHVLAC